VRAPRTLAGARPVWAGSSLGTRLNLALKLKPDSSSIKLSALMELADRNVVITGAGSGIGRALARRIAAERPRSIVVADIDRQSAETVAHEIGGHAVQTDVSREHEIRELVERARDAGGPIDLFCSNAGVPGPGGGPEAPDDEWQHTWEVNVMAHVWAARAVLPEMVARGDGYLLSTASAAGLLTQVSALAYSATKHAAVAVAEWLAINYGDAGVKVSCLCPQGVRTRMLDTALEDPIGAVPLLAGGLLDPEDVAEAVIAGIRDERFLILPHEEVASHMALKGTQPDRWLRGMRRLLRQARESTPGA
jgi:NAD(P)-dependent dehydrogenase (short-subunit alcohol dehydrogenase family)